MPKILMIIKVYIKFNLIYVEKEKIIIILMMIIFKK